MFTHGIIKEEISNYFKFLLIDMLMMPILKVTSISTWKIDEEPKP